MRRTASAHYSENFFVTKAKSPFRRAAEPAAPPALAAPSQEAPRRRGRPPASEKSGTNRQAILQAALKLAKTYPLQDLSIVTVARAMNVTPALIHYYIGGRDWLTSGIMNL